MRLRPDVGPAAPDPQIAQIGPEFSPREHASVDPALPGKNLRATARPDRPAHSGIRGEIQGAGPGRGRRGFGGHSRILAAREEQFRRLAPFGLDCNAQMTPRTLRRFCKLDAESEKQMENAITKLGLSARAYDRILKVSRTIADLLGNEKIQACHVSEAIQYRTLDRAYWQ